MGKLSESFFESVDVFLAWLSTSLKQTTESYCDLETADSETALVAHDGALATIIKIHGAKALIGPSEFKDLCNGVETTLQAAMSRPGYAIQFFFNYELNNIKEIIGNIFSPGLSTAKRLNLDLKDLFRERTKFLSTYCADEQVYLVLWTRPSSLSREQYKQANKEKLRYIRSKKIPPFKVSQTLIAAIPDLREPHDAFVRSVVNDFNALGLYVETLNTHDAVYAMRLSADPDFTDYNWKATLPGDKLTVKEVNQFKGDVSDILWPSLAKQIIPREVENIDLRTVRVGDKIYSSVFIDLFPKEIRPFINLFSRTLASKIPWRISYLIESEGLETLRFKGFLATILSFTSSHNRLLSNATNLLKYIKINTDDAVVRLRVCACTWVEENNISLLRVYTSQLVKAMQGWGAAEVSEICGDPFAGVVSSMLGVTTNSVATPSIAPLSDVITMLPITRPASPWAEGSLIFRTPDGKLWPFYPGSSQQTTWIDLIYARPGAGKSVLSNSINLALTLSSGLLKLPLIAVIDIGPSSSGFISLIRESLPPNQRHYVAYHRIRMEPEYSINPFDTQLGCRYPTATERAFLVNFLTLLATPLGAQNPYDGIPDLVGLVIDEMYSYFADDGNPSTYSPRTEILIDGILDEIGFIQDQNTTWWEVTDALFIAGFVHEAMLAQRYAKPLLADAASVCRLPAIEDLYGKVKVPTGENLISAFIRMISSAIREYPVISRVTSFDLGEASIVSLDLDEVAKSGGDASDRQTAVMYMLARYVLARHYFFTKDHLSFIPDPYKEYHSERIKEIGDAPKRIVYDEFHRTDKASAVREQVLLDMREGRKWKVQVALISQSVDDFDPIMIEFATSIYIMDSGPAQSIKKTSKIFGLSATAQIALRKRVHGPTESGATFLAQFSTKLGINTQLLTLTLGPVELWAFSTTPEDVRLRDQLYEHLSPPVARQILATLFKSGSIVKLVEGRLAANSEGEGIVDEELTSSIVDKLLVEILDAYSKNPDIKSLGTCTLLS